MINEKFLLLSCCAPCSCAVIKTMAEDCYDFDVVFFNPNVVPKAEYDKRRDENKKICELYDVKFIEIEYDNNQWQQATKGLEDEPERGKRCTVCFALRIKKAMEYARLHDYAGVASVLGASRYKDLNQVNEAAQQMSMETGVKYFEIELRKNGMQELANKLMKELSLYHQDYCGCRPR